MAQSFFGEPPVGDLAIPSMLWTFLESAYPEWYVENHICFNNWRHEWAVQFDGIMMPIDEVASKVRERMKRHLIPVGDEWYSVEVK